MALVLYTGIDWRRRITVTTESTGEPVDLTGLSIDFILRRRASDPALIELSVGSGIELLEQDGATLGKADIEIEGAATEDFEAGSCRFVVLVEDQIVLGPLKLPVRPV